MSAHRFAIIVAALIPWAAAPPSRAQGTNATAAVAYPSPRKVVRFPRYVDPLATNAPAASMLPLAMAPAEVLRRRAAAVGKIERLNPSGHSNIGILRGDIQGAERAIDPAVWPEWSMLRWEALAARLTPKARPSVTVTNTGK